MRMSEQKHRWGELEDVEDGEDAAGGISSGFGPVSTWQSFPDSDTAWL